MTYLPHDHQPQQSTPTYDGSFTHPTSPPPPAPVVDGPAPTDLVLDAARAAGLPVIEHGDIHLEPAAVRAVPEGVAGVGIAFHQGFVVVAFPNVPSPAEVDEVQHAVGAPIMVAVAARHVLDQLRDPAVRARTMEIPLIETILDAALHGNASDIHLSVGSAPLARMGGYLAPLAGFPPLVASDLAAIAQYLAGDRVHSEFNGDLDLGVSYGNWRFRVNIFRQRDALAAALRVIPNRIPSFESLLLPDVIKRFAKLRQGIVLVCGPTGSGKSTTLASLVDMINRERAEHIVTIEDPIEYLHGNHQSLVQQREVGEDTASFATAMRSVLRQDPDVILVGEMRDHETISTALTAAETGHLVFSTVHANDAPGVIERIVDVFPEGQQEQIRTQLANTIEGVVCQTLIPSAEEVGKRVAVCEVMLSTPALRNLIREGQNHQIPSAMQSGIDEGMLPRDLALAYAVRDGLITDAQAREWVRDAVAYREYVTKIRRRPEF
jgi:twitching motility protein PilT